MVCIGSIPGSAERTGTTKPIGTIDAAESTVGTGIDHVLRSLGQPPIDEVSVQAERAPARQLERRGAGPAIGDDLTQVVADGEAQLGHAAHTLGAAVLRAERVVPVLRARVRRLERVLVDAVVEQEQRLQVCLAGLCRERRGVLARVGAAAANIAEPLQPGQVVEVGLGGGGGVSGHHLEVLRNGDLSLFKPFVVGAETINRNRSVRGAIAFFVDIGQCRYPLKKKVSKIQALFYDLILISLWKSKSKVD